MTKSEDREIQNITRYYNAGMIVNVALALSALIRAARTKKSKAELIDYAHAFNVINHPDFII
jgi:hypothetical protein